MTKATATSQIAETRYTSFDILGRVLSSSQLTDGQTYNSGYVYNLSGALLEETYPSGRVVKNTLDQDGNLAQVQSAKANGTFQNYANTFTYTAAGAVSSLRLGNGRWENTSFNARLQPVQIGLGSSATNQNLLKLNYDYGTTDNNGNVKSQTITVPTIGTNPAFTATQSYTYDSLNRLKSAVETIPQQTGWQQTFLYDRFGNRTFDTANGNTTTLAAGCQTNVCNPAANPINNRLIGTTYDNAGNTTTDGGAANGNSFVYDAENKQVQVSNSSGIVGTYFYDSDGKRVKKIVPASGETTIFVYDAGGKMVAEYSTVTADTPQISYLTNDTLGSPRITTDVNGAVISRRDFMPFGEEISRAGYGSDSVRQKFTSQERDKETNLDYFKARYFSSGLGRFTSTDPITITPYRLVNPQALNGYGYVANNPIKFTDPSGKQIKFKNQATADEALKLYQNGLEKDEQKYVSVTKNKDGTFSLNVDEKAGKSADFDTLLGRLYKATKADAVAIVSIGKKDMKFSMTVFSADGKSTTKTTSLKELDNSDNKVSSLAGLTLFPVESKDKAIPKNLTPLAFSAEKNATQIIVATDVSKYTPTQAVYAETLAHFGEFVRTGNPSASTHNSSLVLASVRK